MKVVVHKFKFVSHIDSVSMRLGSFGKKTGDEVDKKMKFFHVPDGKADKKEVSTNV